VKSAPLLLTSTVVRIPELDGGVEHSSNDDVTHRARLLMVLLLVVQAIAMLQNY
jgi:hypothetical protein